MSELLAGTVVGVYLLRYGTAAGKSQLAGPLRRIGQECVC